MRIEPVVLSALVLSAALCAQSRTAQRVTANIPGIVKAGTPIELVRDGLAGADDPITLPDGSILFTEPNANRISKAGLDGKVSPFLANTNAGIGMSFDSSGRLIQAQPGGDGHSRIAVIYPPGRETVIAEGYQGHPFNRPNDLIADKKGGIYVTDPGVNGQQREQLQEAQPGKPLAPRLSPAVYYIRPGGVVVEIADGIERPNGITLSPDEKTLYVNNTNGVNMFAFDIQPDGSVRNRRTNGTYEGRSQIPNGIPGIMSGADGLTIDGEGRLYAVTSAGIEIFTPTGQHLGTIRMSCGGMDCQGLAFAGRQKKTLYIAGRGSLWKVNLLAKGFTGRAK